MIPLTIILAVILLYVEARMTNHNFGAPWNGYGCIRSVLQGTAQAPMQYRVLVPFLYQAIMIKGKRGYLIIKGLGIWLTLAGFYWFCRAFGFDGYMGVLFLAAIMPMFFLYDYADCFYEYGLWALALALSTQGQQYLVWLAPVTFLAALNRETGVFIPLSYFALTGGIIGTFFLMGVFIAGALIPRIYFGRKARYCEAVMLRRNWRDLTAKFRFEHILFFLLLFWFVAVGLLSGISGQLADLYRLMGLFVLTVAIPSVWFEIRVFMPVTLVTIPATLLLL